MLHARFVPLEKKHFALWALLLTLGGCGEEPSAIPEGFERVSGQGAAHFVYVDPNFLGDRILQRAAGKAICEQSGHYDYCEVYMWKNRDDVAEKLPIVVQGDAIGIYSQKGGKVTLKSLR